MSEQSEQFRWRVEELVARFEKDVDRSEWITRRYPKRLRGEFREVYEVPALFVQKGPTSLLLDPVGYDVPGAEAAADLYLMPAYDPMVSLYFEAGRWMLHYSFPWESSPSEKVRIVPLSAESMNQALNSIADHAVPSV